MSRPSTPSWSVPTFATTGNYPATGKPWDGAATKVAPVSLTTGFSPKASAGAQYLNYLMNAQGAAHASVLAFSQSMLNFIGQSQVLGTWEAVPVVGSSTFCANPVWDATSMRWVVVSGHSGSVAGYLSYDGCKTWIAANGTPSNITVNTDGLGVIPSGSANAGTVVAFPDGGTSTFYMQPETVVWTTTATGIASSSYTNVVWCQFASKFFAIGDDSTNRHLIFGDGITSWTDKTSALSVMGSSTTNWISGASTSRWVLMSAETGANGGTYITTDDGSTFTTRTLPGGMLSGSPQIRSLAFGAGGWQLAICDTITFTTAVYSSIDAVTWTALWTPTTPMRVLVNAQYLNGIWVMGVNKRPDLAGTPALTRLKIIFSVDNGVSWREGDGFLPAGGGGGVFATDGQRFVTNGNGEIFRSGFSAGLPGAIP